MTKIDIYFTPLQDDFTISIVGHANYAELGKDIVCAGISTLVATLSRMIVREEEANNIDVDTLDITDGNIQMKFQIVNKKSNIYSALRLIFDGFQWLCEEYPNNVIANSYKL